ncbi:MAG: peptide-methionine (R)-S-oxide reductase MsrB [Actinobacteria bacterium]|jgi:peptide-methionine (R)-S-oxide reductase|nr:peptide-methionine (R)-S-oxide reductase MsrB [Actinomycetota bacterium]
MSDQNNDQQEQSHERNIQDDDQQEQSHERLNYWVENLDPEQYAVIVEGATEPPFTGKYLHVKGPGIFHCAACGQALFSTKDKYDSGSGWPSFSRPISGNSIGERKDTSYAMMRIEVHCSRCGGHLGHVFDDGPPPTGKRYCINSLSLVYIET